MWATEEKPASSSPQRRPEAWLFHGERIDVCFVGTNSGPRSALQALGRSRAGNRLAAAPARLALGVRAERLAIRTNLPVKTHTTGRLAEPADDDDSEYRVQRRKRQQDWGCHTALRAPATVLAPQTSVCDVGHNATTRPDSNADDCRAGLSPRGRGKIETLNSETLKPVSPNLLIYKYFNRNSLFFKDLAAYLSQSIDSKRPRQGGQKIQRGTKKMEIKGAPKHVIGKLERDLAEFVHDQDHSGTQRSDVAVVVLDGCDCRVVGAGDRIESFSGFYSVMNHSAGRAFGCRSLRSGRRCG